MAIRLDLLACAALAYAFTAMSVTVAAGRMPSVSAVPGELPPGPGRDTLIRVCTDCHGVDLVEGQRRTRAQWRQLVEDMVSRGANATDDDTKTIISYLVNALGRVNVNKAPAAEITAILELSETDASAIVSYRLSAGEFKNLDDVKKVPGLDSARIEATKERITFAGE